MLTLVTDDLIRLAIPAEPSYGRLARITASSLAGRLGFTGAAIEDLRLAVDETIIFLLRPEGEAGTISLRFAVTDDALAIDAETTAGSGQFWQDQGARARFDALVSDTVDLVEIDDSARRVRLVKHRS